MMRKNIYKYFIFIVGLITIFSLSACSSKTVEKDPFFEKWKQLAKQSLGNSPSPSLKEVDIDEGLTKPRQKKIPTTKNKLPTMPVSLKMKATDIKVIIHALAKAANQNIITNSNISGKVDVNINRVPWAKAFKALLKSNGLTYVWEGSIIRVMSKEDFANELAIEEIKTKQEEQLEAKRQLAPLLTKVIKINFADANSLQKILSQLLTKDKKGQPRGNIVVDQHTNSLIIQAGATDLEKIVKLINTLDKPTDQIHLKAYIVEATRNVARDLGIQWGGKWNTSLNNKDQLQLTGPIGNSGNSFGTGRSGAGFGFNFPTKGVTGSSMETLGAGLNILVGNPSANLLEIQLSALEEEGQIHILSSPSLTTMDNHMAFTENGEKIPYVTYSDGEKEVKFEDAVLRLEMTPHVINDEYLKMEIKVKKDEVDFSKTVDGNPTISKKETQTSLVVRNGETIVISGLSKQTVQEAISGIPGLKDIPGLGYLFKGNNKSKKFEEILIFITPTILQKKEKVAKDIFEDRLTPEDILEHLKSTNNPEAKKWLKKSTQLLKEKNWDEALRTASIASSLDPGLAKAYLYQAICYFHKNKMAKAIKLCNKAILLEPKMATSYNIKGKILEKLGYKRKALKFFEKGCALHNKEACINHKRLFYNLEQ